MRLYVSRDFVDPVSKNTAMEPPPSASCWSVGKSLTINDRRQRLDAIPGELPDDEDTKNWAWPNHATLGLKASRDSGGTTAERVTEAGGVDVLMATGENAENTSADLLCGMAGGRGT
jgi:hypothetical protein